MENVLAFSAIICALVFGYSLALLKEKRVSQKPWNIVLKILVQIIGAVSFLCTFFSLLSQRPMLQKDIPLWAIALISFGLVALFAVMGYLIIDAGKEMKHIIKKGFKAADKSFLWGILLIVMIVLAGSIAVHYYFSPIPILLYPLVVLIWGGIICIIAGFVLLVCGGILTLAFYLLKNLKSIVQEYWKWLLN